MNRGIFGAGVVAVAVVVGLTWPVAAAAQIEIKVKVPVVTFEAEPFLVAVSPGIQVVPEAPYEVFFVNGWYWTYHEHRWYHSRHWKTRWAEVDHGHVPPGLIEIPPGKYKHYKHRKAKHLKEAPGQHKQGKQKPGKSRGHGKGKR